MLKYSDDASPAQVDALFHALADASRRSMVDRLSRGPASVTELATLLTITLAAVVQHLKVLESSGLVTTEKVGRVRSATLRTAALASVEAWIADRRVTWERRYDRLGAFLDSPTPQDPSTPQGETA
ncbi:MAG: Transcriptional regulator, ArsR family protein [Rhodoglobus sp.]|jgi:DNA-binding transcriptional ArsR family regulator|nr:Transcriptional regulator, ArsR family protein [Rhodoglobus sp.]